MIIETLKIIEKLKENPSKYQCFCCKNEGLDWVEYFVKFNMEGYPSHFYGTSCDQQICIKNIKRRYRINWWDSSCPFDTISKVLNAEQFEILEVALNSLRKKQRELTNEKFIKFISDETDL